MTRTIAKAALVVLAAASLNLGDALPASATPIGRLCSFLSITDLTVEGGQRQTGQTNGGPVTDDTSVGATITLTCTIQVGAANNTHAGADAVALSNTGTGAALLAGQMSYVSPEGQPVYLCTQVSVNGTTYYWDASATGVHPNLPGNWSSTGGLCNEAIRQEIFPGPFAPLLDIVDPILTGIVDPVVCPVLAVLFPPEGDITGVWDCPPYDDFSARDGDDGDSVWIACAGGEGWTVCV